MNDRWRAVGRSGVLGLLGMMAVGGAVAEPSTCVVPGLDPNLVVEARGILDTVPLIDGHNDLPWALRERFRNHLGKVDLKADLRQLAEPTHTDLPRLRSGGVGAQLWSVYVPVELEGTAAVQAVVEQIDVVHRLTELYPEALELAHTAEDVERIHGAGRIASLVGIEGGHSINDSLAVLRALYALGARYMTITHWKGHAWADAATSPPEHGGLTPFGEEVIREMNRLGMLVDLSHVSENTMLDTLAVSEAPVIFSHSSARGVTAHPRNVPDSVLRKLQDNGGVVMVTFVPVFVSEALRSWSADQGAEKARLEALHIGDPTAAEAALAAWIEAHPAPSSTLSMVADHIDHVRQVAGIDHIGIGSDYDGISQTPDGLEDVSCYPALLAELMRRGYSVDDIRKIAGRNVLRVMRRAEAVSARLRQARPASDQWIEDFATPSP